MNKRTLVIPMLSLILGVSTVLSGCTDGTKPAASSAPSEKSTSESPILAMEPSTALYDVRIHVNQVGYQPIGPKVAVIASDAQFPELKVTVVDRYNDNKSVWEGIVPAAKQDTNSGDWVSQVDFGQLTTEGLYHLKAAGNESFPFRIHQEVYKDLFYNVARSYRLQRSGESIDDPILGLKLSPGHGQDKKATLFFKDKNEKRKVMDVHGGWYDAGDYGKYIPVAAVTVAQLLLAYELRSDYFADTSFLLDNEQTDWKPAKAAPDVLTEVKFELDWMLRMQREDGAVYHKVSGGAFPDFIEPAVDTQDRMVYGMSTYGTAMFAAATAMAARIYEPFDPMYSAELLQHAKLAESWLDAHPDAYFRMDDGQNSGSGPYDKATDREERFWAQAELLKTTGDTRYAAAIQSAYADLVGRKSTYISWNNALLLGQWAVATADHASSENKGAAIQSIMLAADEILEQVNSDGYRSALLSSDYIWASNKIALAKGEIMLLANEFDPKSAYVDAAADQLHYVLGRNTMRMSYVTLIGTLYPVHPHHRISAASGILVPGLMVGGPNAYLNDPVLEKMAELGLPPAKSYIDELLSYASNEYAIDYNAPLFFTLAFME